MNILSIKPMKLLLPGVFLFVLGFGNIFVGSFKGRQYEQILEQLKVIEPSSSFVDSSPLKRMQESQRALSRLSNQIDKAKARIEFYQFINLGGTIMTLLSFVLIGASAVLYYYQSAQSMKA